MNIKSYKFAIVAVITFIILFLMNYIGSEEADRLSRALLTAFAGVIGLTIGMWFVYKNRDDNGNQQHFD
ncbi:MAG: hypothetical protein QM564_09090 [Bergeyella sp.]